MVWLQVYGGQGAECGGLNENDPYMLIYLKTPYPMDGAIWGGLGGVALLEKVCHCGWALRFQRSKLVPVFLS